MEVKAQLNYLRTSPRKTRLVLDLIRGLSVEEAEIQLRFSEKNAAKSLIKLLNSAVASAVNNFNLKKENLYIKKIIADQGPTLQRWMPRAFGRAAPIRKRSCHIKLVLAEIKPAAYVKKSSDDKKREKLKVMAERPKEDEGAAVQKQGKEKPAGADESKEEPFDVRRKGKHRHQEHQDKRAGKTKGFLRKLFSRKAV